MNRLTINIDGKTVVDLPTGMDEKCWTYELTKTISAIARLEQVSDFEDWIMDQIPQTLESLSPEDIHQMVHMHDRLVLGITDRNHANRYREACDNVIRYFKSFEEDTK